jgi:hypothetical protein
MPLTKVQPGLLEATGTASSSTFLRGDGAWSTTITSGTAVASTSGTSIDFTGIPSTAKRITVMFNGVSTTGTSNPIVQLGDSGGIEITSYAGGHTAFASSVLSTVSTTDGICVYSPTTAGDLFSGVATICLLSGNTWAASGATYSAAPRGTTFASSKTLSATLDRIRITTQTGVPTFDAGSINIMWE